MIQTDFENYLQSLGISKKSHKNYRSDLNHFMGWIILKFQTIGISIESLDEVIPFLDTNLGKEYRDYMAENKLPVKTINRRLSTLRHLSRFFTVSNICDFDFMDKVANMSLGIIKKEGSLHPLISEFIGYLEAEKVSKNTIKNYQSDIRQFINWLENNHAQTI